MNTLSNSEDRQAIFRRIAQLSPDDQAQWGRMSVHQMVCHLRDSYCLALGERAANPATGFLQRTLLKWLALWLPVQWRKGFPTRPEVEQGKGGSLPAEFTGDLRTLERVLGRFCDELPEPCIAHPIFGAMRADEWWRWGYLHADHHLRQFGR